LKSTGILAVSEIHDQKFVILKLNVPVGQSICSLFLKLFCQLCLQTLVQTDWGSLFLVSEAACDLHVQSLEHSSG